MQKIKISVVIAAFNEEERIRRCLQAVGNQTFPRDKYEILVIDNNSTDNTSELAKEFGANVIFYDKKQGAVVAKQFGVENARGEIVAITDADSFPHKDWLENIDKIMQDKNIKCTGGTVFSTEGELAKLAFILYDFFARLNQMFGISLIWGPNMAIRKSAFMEVGGFDTKLRTSDDWEFVLRIQKKFGICSTLYSSVLQAKTSPRKHQKLSSTIPYLAIGILNYVSVFILRRSKTFGKLRDVR
jgi:glycosyltransferase involved in cell wall biosynthesis